MRTPHPVLFRLRNVQKPCLLAGIAFACAFGSERSAHASGYLTARFGSDQGTPAMPNTYAVYFNPAALGGTTGTTITGDASVIVRHATYTRGNDALSPTSPSRLEDPAYVQANTGKGSLTNLLAIPFIGVNSDLGSKWLRVGAAFYVPFGGAARWDRGDAGSNPSVPGAIDGPQRWHNISGTLLSFYATAAAAAKFGPFSIGVSVSPVYTTLSTVRARNFLGDDDTAVNGKLQEGRSLVTGSSINLSAAAGIYYEPEDHKFRLGLSYTSQPGFGEMRLRGELKQVLGNGATSAADVTATDLIQTYPDIWRLGGTQKLSEKWELRGDFEFVRWSVFDKQCLVRQGSACDIGTDGDKNSPDFGKFGAGNPEVIVNIPRKWKDSVGLRIGPNYALSESVELFGSVGMTTPAVPKATIDSATIDALRLYLAVGGQFKLNRHIGLGASYNHIAFFTVDTEGKSEQQKYAQASRSPSAAGKYASQIGMLNLNLSYTF
jgi:long-chain fatty acid transport protein